ncbi:MAG: alpha/beta fold hydrolase [Ktedonobacterales bacterium]
MAQRTFPWGRAAAIGGAAVAAPIVGGCVYSAVAIDHAVPLSPAITADRRRLQSAQAGELSHYADERATGRPLVLVHSINAAASAYEMRPLFERYRSQRPVYALDLPGFGFSERSDRVYSPQLYTEALLDLLRDIESRQGAADVIALSLGSEFAARAAQQQPELVRSLTLISPSGLTARTEKNRSERAGASPVGTWLHRLFLFPLWSQALYDLLASRPSIRYFLKKSFVGEPDRELAAYDYATAHQPGARFAPFTFVSGQLFSPDIRESVYERLSVPVLVLYDQDGFVRFDALPAVLERNPNWRAIRIVPSKGLPQFERPEDTTQALDTFWQAVEAGQPLKTSRLT